MLGGHTGGSGPGFMARWVTAGLLLAAAGCATGGVAPAGPTPGGTAFLGVPGFDTRSYPGDSAMARWRRESPYRWVGYYLPAACHTDSSWVGRRGTLAAQGWGTAVIYTGEQDWGAARTVSGPSTASAAAGGARADTTAARRTGADSTAGAPSLPAATAAPRLCTRTNLTAERARADAALADSASAAEGFPQGSYVYLDVEPVDSVSTPLATYVAAWTGALLDRGRYRPALYAHARNADSLRAVQSRQYTQRGVTAGPRVWVAGGSAAATPFDVHLAPAASGVAYANIWQGSTNVDERWGGSALRVDVNVADNASPSSAGAAAPAGTGAGR